MSYYRNIGGKRMDRALLEAFQRSVEGQGDGRISGSDVAKEIKARTADGKGLTQVEIDTLQYAAENFNVTGRGQNELTSLVEGLTDKPVFAWQATGNVGEVRAGQLSRDELNAKVASFVVKNSSDGASVDDDKIFPGVDSSNMGTYAYTLEGKDADRLMRFASDYFSYPGARQDRLKAFDKDKHLLVALRTTFDEESLYVAYADRKTGAVTVVGEMGLVDVEFEDQADFEARTGMNVSDIEGQDPEYMDEIDAISLNDALLAGGRLLHTGKTDDIFGEASDRAMQSASYALNSDWRDENIMSGSVDASAGQIPFGMSLTEAGPEILKDAIYMSEWKSASAGPAGPASDRSLQKAAKLIHRGFDYAPQNTESFAENLARIEGLVKQLGKLKDLEVVEVKGKAETFSDEETDMGAIVFHNKKTGDFVAFSIEAP